MVCYISASSFCFSYGCCVFYLFFFFFKQKTAYEMRISDWSSDVCSSDLPDQQGFTISVMAYRYPPGSPLHHENLKAKQRELRGNFPEPLTLRVHRALSWLRRAEAEQTDEAVRFILLWIGFNAAYAGDVERSDEHTSELQSLMRLSY